MAHTGVYPDAMDRPATKLVRAQLLSSRARSEDAVASTPSDYTYDFGTEIKGVTTLQLGDFTLDSTTDPRLPFDQSRRHFQIQQPLHLTVSTTVEIDEINYFYTVDKSSGDQLVSITTTTGAVLALPPTINTVSTVDTAGATVELTTGVDHNISEVHTYWPTAAGDPFLVGTRMNNGDPEINTANTIVIDADEIGLEKNYLTQTFTTNVAGGSDDATCFVDGTQSCYLYTPRLTVPEYCRTLDLYMSELQSQGSLTARYRFKFDDKTGAVQFFAESGLVDDSRAGQRIDRVPRLTVQAGDVVNRLGLPSGTFLGPFLQSQRRNGDGVYIDTTPSMSTWIPRDARTVELPQASYTDVASLVEVL